MDYTEKQLTIGKMRIYDFGDIKLHAYETKDALNDECYIIESKNELTGIELPTWEANTKEYQEYVKSLNKPLKQIFVDLHPIGASHFNSVKFISTHGAEKAIADGSTRGTLTALSGISGFNAEDVVEMTDYVEDSKITLDGVDYQIVDRGEEYDIIIPAINAVYTHMLGAPVHSIVAGVAGANEMLARLKGYQDSGYELILTSHFTPETLEDVATKIAYVEKEKQIARDSKNAEEFKAKMKAEFPDYAGENYLDMSVGMFFPTA